MINWTEQNKLYGLNYSSKTGLYKDFVFDIRYDYDGDKPKVKPEDCGCCLSISFNSIYIEKTKFGDIDSLTKEAEKYLEKFLLIYSNKQ
jgi:hypothetical protein